MLQLRSAIHARHAPATLAAPVVVVPVPAPAPVPGPPGYYPPAGPSRSPLSPLAWAVLAGVAYAGVVAGGAWLFFTVRRALGPATPQRSRGSGSRAAGTTPATPGKPTYTPRKKETARTKGIGDFESLLDHLRPKEVNIPVGDPDAFYQAAESRGYKRAGTKMGKVMGSEREVYIYKRD